MKVKLGHSPDADDAFMFYPLAQGCIETGEYEFDHELQDIETLNRRTMRQELDVSAVSIHAFPYISDDYALLSCGASVGDGYGPLLVARKGETLARIVKNGMVAVPGTLTTAFLALKLLAPEIEHREYPFDSILSAVAAGEITAGVIIHEGQLTYRESGLEMILDLGAWWKEETGLPLPLGGNVIRRGLGESHIESITAILKASFAYALENRPRGVAHAMEYSRGMSEELVDRFVSMYVNDYTLDLGETGREAVRILLERGYDQGIITQRPRVEFVG